MQFSIEYHDSVGSTQDLAFEKAASGAEEGYVVQAGQQETGRGRQGKRWVSPGGNIYMSLILRPSCSLEDIGQSAFVLACALGSAAESFVTNSDAKVTLKWPNDIYISSLKNAGILLENNIKNGSVDFLVAGLGVNVKEAPEEGASLQHYTDKELKRDEVRDKILEEVDLYYGIWRDKGFAPIRKSWLKRAHGLDQPITVRTGQKEMSGIFRGIDDVGALILDKDGTLSHITATEVFFDVLSD